MATEQQITDAAREHVAQQMLRIARAALDAGSEVGFGGSWARVGKRAIGAHGASIDAMQRGLNAAAEDARQDRTRAPAPELVDQAWVIFQRAVIAEFNRLRALWLAAERDNLAQAERHGAASRRF